MLQIISDMPVHVLGVHAIGEVKKDDIRKVLIPKLEEMVAVHGEINYLLVMETEIKNFTIGALLEDMMTGLDHYTKWNKIAVVSDQTSVIWFSNMFKFFIPGEAKGYPLNKLDEAVIWVSERRSNI
ncbi:MAG: STAS/SEC14 domain-containing protein [Sphingobacteriaceae bacterium]|nr:MAG: STAS/SEC14 domain-containing protein [Sphingobacteriaceae bacterium]